MATSFVLNSANSYDGRYLQVSCTQTKNIATNQSTISWTLSALGGTSTDYTTGPTTLVINGVTVYSKGRTAWSTQQFPARAGSVSGSLVVDHNSTGNKSVGVSLSTAIYTSTVTTNSGTWTLDNIPRYANITKFTVDKLSETSVKVTWGADASCDKIYYSTNNGSSFVETSGYPSFNITGLSANTTYNFKIRVRRADSQLLTTSGTVSQTTYNYPYCTSTPNFLIGNEVTFSLYNPLGRSVSVNLLTADDTLIGSLATTGTSVSGYNSITVQNRLYASIPNAKSGTYKVNVTYGSVNKVRSNNNTYSVRGTETPTFTNFTFADTNATVTAVTGNNQVFVIGKSTLQVTVSQANKMVAKNSATASKYIAVMDTLNKSANYSSSDVNIAVGTPVNAGTKRLTVTAYDSRNLYTAVNKDITVYDYSVPVVNATVTRLNNFEAQTTLKVNGSYTRLTIENTDKNTITAVQYRYRESGSTWGNWTNITTTLNNGNYTCTDTILSLDNTKTFEFEIKAVDRLGTTTISKTVNVGIPIFFISKTNKNCLMNDKLIAVDEDVPKMRNYTELADNTDLNDIVNYGTYRSTSTTHTGTMSNVPSGVTGGFTLYVMSWTWVNTSTQYMRQELKNGASTYVRQTSNGGTTWSEWIRQVTDNSTDVPLLTKYIRLPQNADLNDYATIGTYRSIQNADTQTMSNVPININGGFKMVVSTWTSSDTNQSYRKQEIEYMDKKYIRTTSDGGSTWTDWRYDNFNVYSTSETIVGTWTDGKPIYRKVFAGTFQNGQTLVSNVRGIIRISGMSTIADVIRTLPYYEYYNGNSYTATVRLSAGKIVTQFYASGIAVSSASTIILEYTKSTD